MKTTQVVVTVLVPQALTDTNIPSLLSYMQLPLVNSPWWPIKQHRQPYSWTLPHKGHLSKPIMELLHLGNIQDKLGTGNKEQDKVQQHLIGNDQKAWLREESTARWQTLLNVFVQGEKIIISQQIFQCHRWLRRYPCFGLPELAQTAAHT